MRAFPAPQKKPSLGIKYERVIRDCLHGDIVMTEFEWEILRTPEFQRLRWMRQLGTTHLVYIGAEHRRFSHAIGTMKVASEILRRMEEHSGNRYDPEDWLIARTYSLVHDVLHIPFGHALEDELQIFARHDDNDGRASRLLHSDRSTLGEVLRSTTQGQAVLAKLDSKFSARKDWITELVDAPYGADVLDYIDRDAFHCGLDNRVDSAVYRRFAVEQQYRPQDPKHFVANLFGRHGFRMDADFALGSILRERYTLFMKVYTHTAKVAAGAMIGKALWEVRNDGKDPQIDEKEIEWMGDDELLIFLRESKRPLAEGMARRILRRQLYEPAFRSRALDENNCDVLHYEAKQDRFRKSGYLDPAGRRKPGVAEVRDEVHGQNLQIYADHIALWTVMVLIPPDKDKKIFERVGKIAHEILGLENEMAHRPRQLTFSL